MATRPGAEDTFAHVIDEAHGSFGQGTTTPTLSRAAVGNAAFVSEVEVPLFPVSRDVVL